MAMTYKTETVYIVSMTPGRKSRMEVTSALVWSSADLIASQFSASLNASD